MERPHSLYRIPKFIEIYLVETRKIIRNEINPKSDFTLLLSRLHNFQGMSLSRIIEFHFTKLIKNPVLSIDDSLTYKLRNV